MSCSGFAKRACHARRAAEETRRHRVESWRRGEAQAVNLSIPQPTVGAVGLFCIWHLRWTSAWAHFRPWLEANYCRLLRDALGADVGLLRPVDCAALRFAALHCTAVYPRYRRPACRDMPSDSHLAAVGSKFVLRSRSGRCVQYVDGVWCR